MTAGECGNDRYVKVPGSETPGAGVSLREGAVGVIA